MRDINSYTITSTGHRKIDTLEGSDSCSNSFGDSANGDYYYVNMDYCSWGNIVDHHDHIPVKNNALVSVFCNYCGTRIFSEDRGCVACGAPIRL